MEINDELTKADRDFGQAGEMKAYNALKFFDPSLTIHEKRFDEIDFIGNSADVELKTRTCRYGAFPDIMIGCNKATKLKAGKKLYFAFQFTNGIWYIEYTSEAFNNIDKKIFKRSRSFDREQLCFFIPLDRLTKLN
jgi:hypothetical protein